MLTDEQIQWLVPVFNTAYDILSKIPDIEPASMRGHRINAAYFKDNSCYYEFFLIKIKAYSKLLTWNMVMSIIRYMDIQKKKLYNAF